MSKLTPGPRQVGRGLRTVARRARYFGGRRSCAVCGASVRRFLPGGLQHAVLKDLAIVGGGVRAEAQCPVCRSMDRERLVSLYLRHRTTVFTEPLRVLHVAPEPTLERILAACPQIEYVTADLLSDRVMMNWDITNLPVDDARFDIIVCNHVLEHIPDDRAAMRELHRVLARGGIALLQAPWSPRLGQTYEDPTITAPDARERAFGQWDHVRVYGRDYVDRLRECGFEVDAFAWFDDPKDFGGPENRFGLNRDELVFTGRKTG